MQDLIKGQCVRKRARTRDSYERKSLLAKADYTRMKLSRPKKGLDHIHLVQKRQRKKRAIDPRLKLIALVFCALCALSPIAVLPLFPMANRVPQNLIDDKGGSGDSSYQRAMLEFSGLKSEAIERIDSGDGFSLDISETFRWDNYRVKSGDTVSSIAARNSLSIDSIISLNKLVNVKRLYVGQVIKIPNMDGIVHVVARGDNLARIARAQGVPIEAILDANDLETDVLNAGMSLFIPGARMRRDELKMAMGEFFIYPVNGRFTSGFGWRNDPFTGQRSFHNGIDISARQGTPIKAGMDGRVSSLGTNAIFGHYIIITHSSGYQTLYAHMHTRSVRQGQWVLQGATIGKVGTTGRSTGPHLHFSIYKNGRAINPMQFLTR